MKSSESNTLNITSIVADFTLKWATLVTLPSNSNYLRGKECAAQLLHARGPIKTGSQISLQSAP
jgi:hypothetical protein